MTQQQLADAAGVSLKTISNIENESLTPQRGTLRKIREALGLSSDLAVAMERADEPVRVTPELDRRQAGTIEQRLGDLEGRVTRIENGLGAPVNRGDAEFAREVTDAIARLSEDARVEFLENLKKQA